MRIGHIGIGLKGEVFGLLTSELVNMLEMEFRNI